MIRSITSTRYILIAIIFVFLLAISTVGCSSLGPNMSYQGRLTDASGNQLNGSYSFTFRLYNDEDSGDLIYEESESIDVENGLFDTSIGPATLLEGVGLTPEMLTQPLWLEVEIGGETLAPRQRLLGAPYAFTLMPGAVISSTFNTTIPGNAADAILKVVNNDTSSSSYPALQLVGNVGLELIDINGSHGTITSDLSQVASDIYVRSNDTVSIFLDDDGGSTGEGFWLFGNPTTHYCHMDGENGNFECTGTITQNALFANGERRSLYSTQSTEVQVEDFGNGQLVSGQASVSIDETFSSVVSLDDYYVFVTPLGDCNGLYVTNKTATGFEVHELSGGTANIDFDYRIVAKRAGYENMRMELAEPEVMDEEEK